MKTFDLKQGRRKNCDHGQPYVDHKLFNILERLKGCLIEDIFEQELDQERNNSLEGGLTIVYREPKLHYPLGEDDPFKFCENTWSSELYSVMFGYNELGLWISEIDNEIV